LQKSDRAFLLSQSAQRSIWTIDQEDNIVGNKIDVPRSRFLIFAVAVPRDRH